MDTRIIFVVMVMVIMTACGMPPDRENLEEELQLRILQKLLEKRLQEEQNAENQADMREVEDDNEKRELLDAKIQELEQDIAALDEQFNVVARNYDEVSSQLEARRLELKDALKEKEEEARDYPKRDLSPLDMFGESLKKRLEEDEEIKRFLDGYDGFEK